MPACRQRSGLCLAIADNTGDDQIRIVERGAIGVREGIAKLAALVDGARRFGCDVTWNSARKRELREEALHPLLVAGDVRVYLAVGTFQISVGDQCRPSVSRSGHVDHVEVVRFDKAIQMRVDEVQSRRCAPVPKQSRLDVVLGQRLLEQRIIIEIDLTDRKVVGGSPVRIYQCPFVVRQHVCHHRLRDLLSSMPRVRRAGSPVNRRTVLRNAESRRPYQAVLFSHTCERIVALHGLLQ